MSANTLWAVLFLAVTRHEAVADPCTVRSDDVPCLHVENCQESWTEFGHFLVSNVHGRHPSQPDDHGPRHAGTKLEYMCMRPRMIGMYSPPWTKCDSPVFTYSDVLEVFIAPVTSPTSNPISYFELDTSPSGVLWAGLSNNSLGNSSVCVSADGCEHPGTLLCSGAAVFPHGLTVNATNTTPTSWSTSLFIPWSLFSDEFQPVEAFSGLKPWKTWRANFYRYDYPDGPHGTAIILRWLR